MKLVFHQVQREGQLLVVELRLEGDMVMSGEPGQQVANLRTAVDGQARRCIPQVQLRVVLHILNEVQFILGQKRVTLHRSCSLGGIKMPLSPLMTAFSKFC
jgi:hypothetical protein